MLISTEPTEAVYYNARTAATEQRVRTALPLNGWILLAEIFVLSYTSYVLARVKRPRAA